MSEGTTITAEVEKEKEKEESRFETMIRGQGQCQSNCFVTERSPTDMVIELSHRMTTRNAWLGGKVARTWNSCSSDVCSVVVRLLWAFQSHAA